MGKAITDVGTLSRYVRGVLRRAEHHAGDVDAVCLTIAGAVLWRTKRPPEVREQDGKLKNVLWTDIGKRRFALTYNHEAGSIDVLERGLQGKLLASFTNKDSAAKVKKFFARL